MHRSGYHTHEWLPNGSERGPDWRVDFVGWVAMLTPEMAADVLEGVPLSANASAMLSSDCTTAPRNGLTSGVIHEWVSDPA
jgi:hypothetical protein